MTNWVLPHWFYFQLRSLLLLFGCILIDLMVLDLEQGQQEPHLHNDDGDNNLDVVHVTRATLMTTHAKSNMWR